MLSFDLGIDPGGFLQTSVQSSWDTKSLQEVWAENLQNEAPRRHPYQVVPQPAPFH